MAKKQFGYCTVCGVYSNFFSDLDDSYPCKRNSFVCEFCGSNARNRHIAYAILDSFKERCNSASLKDFCKKFDGKIYITCSKGSIYDVLHENGNVTVSQFFEDVPSGNFVDGVVCQDLQMTSFESEAFDIVITEDVLEHVPNPVAALDEIKRILKLGGAHFATIPVTWNELTQVRARIINGEVVYLMEPEYHGDPHVDEGILEFTEFGYDLVDSYLNRIGPTKIYWANEDVLLEKVFSIYNNWVYVSTKLPA